MPASVAPPQEFARFSFPPHVDAEAALAAARTARNHAWRRNPLIPSWVSPESVDLDRYFTRPNVAHACYAELLSSMTSDHANPSRYTFVEPAAGDGVFFDLLPEGRRFGVEIVPGRPDLEAQDYLSWMPPQENRPFAVIGNPPFGYRAWLALAFINHSAVFADYIGMILPMAFQSDGKGSPKFRVEGAELVESKPLPKDSFVLPSGQSSSVNALWQVWRRGVNNRIPPATCDDWLDLFTVDMRKERLCGQERLPEADWFLQRTFYGEPPKLVKDFSDVQYVCGYGIVLKKHGHQVVDALNAVDWRDYSNLAAHNCRHISMYHIRQALTDRGFTDA